MFGQTDLKSTNSKAMMKRLLPCAILLLFSFSGLKSQVVEKTFYFSNPRVITTGVYQQVNFENTMLTAKTGEPELPYQSISLLLPPGKSAESITIIPEEETDLPGTYQISPRQESRPVSAGPSGEFSMNRAVYSSSQPYPPEAAGHLSTQFLNGYSFALSAFTPVRYIPLTGKISYFKKVTVRISTGKSPKAERALDNLKSTDKIIKQVTEFAQNPASIAEYPFVPVRDDSYQILIITPQSLEGQYAQLRFMYLQRGLKSETVTTEWIESNMPGQDMPEQIRNYIIQEYQGHSIEYVILGGDAELVPYRGFWAYVISGSGYEDYGIPADVYYSGLDGTWNDNGNAKWAEPGEDDLLPDVAVARLPVDNVVELQKILHKSISYQDTPVLGELNKPLLAGENLYANPLTWGSDYLKLLIGYHEDNGYVTNGIQDSSNILTMYDEDSEWSGNDLMLRINQGRSFIHHSGHANETYVMKLDISDITNSNFSQVNGINHNYTFVYTHGCLDGAFDVNECIGEAMVLIDNFAAAGAFNSRYGWFNEGQTEGPSAHLHREFVDALYDKHESRIGEAHRLSKVETAPWVNAPGQWEEGALRWCFYCCNILGDPVLSVYTDEPADFNIDYPEEITLGENSVTVTVTNDGQPVAGMSCVIMAGMGMVGCKTTDSTGQAVIDIQAGFNGFTTADLVVSGYNRPPVHNQMSILTQINESSSDKGSLDIIPNPFHEILTISYSLETGSTGTLSIYNAMGQLMKSIPAQEKTAGKYLIHIDAGNWPAGVYYSVLKSESSVIMRKLIREN
jgi:hypothetical protein